MAVILVEEITSEKSIAETFKAQAKKISKPKKVVEDDDDLDDEEEVAPKKGAKKVKSEEEDDDEPEKDDDWDAKEEDEDWDPDFEEFDLPKSNAKKSGTAGKKAGKGDDEDLGIDDEFKDMDLFNDSGIDDDEDDY